MKSLKYYLIFLIPIIFIAGNMYGGIFNFSVVFTLFVITPIADLLIGTDKSNPLPDEESRVKDMFRFRLITFLCIPIQLFIITWALFIFNNSSLTTSESVGLILSAGITSGILGINIAHELSHRLDNKLEPLLARILLLTTGYVHWSIEHVYGHHRTVATPDDPATAKNGETIISFIPKTIIGGMISSWKIETERLKKRGIKKWNIRNKVIFYSFVNVLILLFIYSVFEPETVMFFVAQSAVAIILLEIVNYVEHYGLKRNRINEDEYEPVETHHSWNSNHMITNCLLFNLQRHSDHHYAPLKRYQVLRHYNESPQLPTEYPGMILITLIPPLWRFVMDKKS